MTGFPRSGPIRRVVASVLTSTTLLVLSVSGGQAQSLGPQVSINIVEPRDQSKWGYAPATKSVAPGTWVTWSNNGQDEHTVTALDGSFDSSTLEPSEGFSWYFDQPGMKVSYTCTLHTWMTGTIVVTGQAAPPPLPADDPAKDDQPPDD